MRRFRILISLLAVITLSWSAQAQRYDRGFDMSKPSTFVSKGTWMMGGTASWSFGQNDHYKVLVIDDVNSTGYRLSVSPAFCYMLRDNMGIGMRFDYNRYMLELDSADINVGDVGVSFENYHTIGHKFTTMAILRNYIPLGNSKRFALFNETQLSVGFGQGKVVDGHSQAMEGSYETRTSYGVNICPGMVAFANEHFAVEFSVNMLGLGVTSVDQTHNQVYHGERRTTTANFKVNILSVGFGIYYYL